MAISDELRVAEQVFAQIADAVASVLDMSAHFTLTLSGEDSQLDRKSVV